MVKKQRTTGTRALVGFSPEKDFQQEGLDSRIALILSRQPCVVRKMVKDNVLKLFSAFGPGVCLSQFITILNLIHRP